MTYSCSLSKGLFLLSIFITCCLTAGLEKYPNFSGIVGNVYLKGCNFIRRSINEK